uniref:Uncharacterized protein n=1 Tax=Chromera velia CCMP2878 TaxID=1169474 RepID=A0A0G4GXN1_9ALVE|eukprot:Cvel_794.t1-p1 / transcript=Cvel_794.t1 / gene=Cvel_794 / organism=Chromera_velia_CCMP2878 / gene_product=Sterol 3-beta-glucosyltransferase UGT80B1, putative / transcript_product=Sterol 3-beta-glucosyltransferase UGT80B1, putative / location=Cvel_scaffold24:177501-192596(-) / protein_length=1532 / sequence_SO=supercontig / SO=protein_coding / is_pseudo=false
MPVETKTPGGPFAGGVPDGEEKIPGVDSFQGYDEFSRIEPDKVDHKLMHAVRRHTEKLKEEEQEKLKSLLSKVKSEEDEGEDGEDESEEEHSVKILGWSRRGTTVLFVCRVKEGESTRELWLSHHHLCISMKSLDTMYPELLCPDLVDVIFPIEAAAGKPTSKTIQEVARNLEAVFEEFLKTPAVRPHAGEILRMLFVHPQFIEFVPKMNVLILIVGTRGDVQPFIAMAQRLHQVARNLEAVFEEFLKTPAVRPHAGEILRMLFVHPQFIEFVPKMNVLILIVGTRGDVQPFIAMAQRLHQVGHRVRLSTHEHHKDFVRKECTGCEFYPLGGDPDELIAYMVRNGPGLMPRDPRDIPKKRQMMKEIMWSSWKAAVSPSIDDGTPFIANAIISNPPLGSHVHLAERLGIPLHVYFTMPWSPTKEFCHPLVYYGRETNAYENWLSFFLFEKFWWIGVSDLVNSFRTSCLDLEPIGMADKAEHLLSVMKVPISYMWSPSLIDKPEDWESHIDVVGFFFLDSLSRRYTPPQALATFLNAGSPPLYIGFGSIVCDTFDRVMKEIIKALRDTGVRALIYKGGSGQMKVLEKVTLPSNVFMMDGCPHDWLFPQCAAVCHHGGAGTTAAGLKAGKPTIIVPFFGDQFFWGDTVKRYGAGPEPIPAAKISSKAFAEAIKICQKPETVVRAQEVAQKMSVEDGVEMGVASFHRQLPLDLLQCEVCAYILSQKLHKSLQSGGDRQKYGETMSLLVEPTEHARRTLSGGEESFGSPFGSPPLQPDMIPDASMHTHPIPSLGKATDRDKLLKSALSKSKKGTPGASMAAPRISAPAILRPAGTAGGTVRFEAGGGVEESSEEAEEGAESPPREVSPKGPGTVNQTPARRLVMKAHTEDHDLAISALGDQSPNAPPPPSPQATVTEPWEMDSRGDLSPSNAAAGGGGGEERGLRRHTTLGSLHSRQSVSLSRSMLPRLKSLSGVTKGKGLRSRSNSRLSMGSEGSRKGNEDARKEAGTGVAAVAVPVQRQRSKDRGAKAAAGGIEHVGLARVYDETSALRLCERCDYVLNVMPWEQRRKGSTPGGVGVGVGGVELSALEVGLAEELEKEGKKEKQQQVAGGPGPEALPPGAPLLPLPDVSVTPPAIPPQLDLDAQKTTSAKRLDESFASVGIRANGQPQSSTSPVGGPEAGRLSPQAQAGGQSEEKPAHLTDLSFTALSGISDTQPPQDIHVRWEYRSVDWRGKHRSEPIRSFAQGARSGWQKYKQCMKEAAKGLVSRPAEGIRTGGFTGAAIGVGLGVAGLVYKPILGTANLVYDMSRGAWSGRHDKGTGEKGAGSSERRLLSSPGRQEFLAYNLAEFGRSRAFTSDNLGEPTPQNGAATVTASPHRLAVREGVSDPNPLGHRDAGGDASASSARPARAGHATTNSIGKESVAGDGGSEIGSVRFSPAGFADTSLEVSPQVIEEIQDAHSRLVELKISMQKMAGKESQILESGQEKGEGGTEKPTSERPKEISPRNSAQKLEKKDKKGKRRAGGGCCRRIPETVE